MEEQDKIRAGEPEEDVEAHKKRLPLASDEPQAEGDSDDDVELHKKVSPS